MLQLVGRDRAGPGTRDQERQKEERSVLREKWNQERETKRQTTRGAVRRPRADRQSRQKEVVEQDQVGDLIDLTELIDLTDLIDLI